MSEKCDKKTEVYSRVVGYFRPIKKWNLGKQQEFKERRVFKVEEGQGQRFDTVEEIQEPKKTPDTNKRDGSIIIIDDPIRENTDLVVKSILEDWYEQIGAMKT